MTRQKEGSWLDWPPEFFDDGGEMDNENWWERHQISILMSLLLLIGLALLGVSEAITFSPVTDFALWPVVNWMGTGLVTAGLIGLIIDQTAKRRILRDVFREAMGYVLPQELRPAMRWVYNQRIICIEHIQSCDLRINPEDKDSVIVKVTRRRSYKNTSTNTESLEVGGPGVDEWFFDTGETRIMEVGYSMGDISETLISSTNQSRVEAAPLPHPYRIAAKSYKIQVPGGAKVETWSTFEEIRRVNDSIYSFFPIPTVEPLVTVSAPEGIEIIARFHSSQIPSDPPMQGQGQYRLHATLLPSQAILVRWYRLEDSEKLKAKYEQPATQSPTDSSG